MDPDPPDEYYCDDPEWEEDPEDDSITTFEHDPRFVDEWEK